MPEVEVADSTIDKGGVMGSSEGPGDEKSNKGGTPLEAWSPNSGMNIAEKVKTAKGTLEEIGVLPKIHSVPITTFLVLLFFVAVPPVGFTYAFSSIGIVSKVGATYLNWTLTVRNGVFFLVPRRRPLYLRSSSTVIIIAVF